MASGALMRMELVAGSAWIMPGVTATGADTGKATGTALAGAIAEGVIGRGTAAGMTSPRYMPRSVSATFTASAFFRYPTGRVPAAVGGVSSIATNVRRRVRRDGLSARATRLFERGSATTLR